MGDISKFAIQRYLQTKKNSMKGNLVEVIEFENLLGNVNFNGLQEYLE